MLRVALDGIELEVDQGARLAIAGPSGAGKTTLLRRIAGLAPAVGRIDCGDETWLDSEHGIDVPAERRRTGFLFQDYALFPHLSARANVEFAGSRAGELLDRLGIDSETAERKPPTLSGGERQRVALARAFARDPAVLLLDIAAPAIIVTHDFEEAAVLGDEVAILDAGRIVQRGPASELAAQPASAFVADLTGAVVLSGYAFASSDGLTKVELEGGGVVLSTDAAAGVVGVSIHPWDIALSEHAPEGSTVNHLEARIESITTIGNRVRIGLHASQPLIAEITGASALRLRLEPGAQIVASWKATATRLVPLR